MKNKIVFIVAVLIIIVSLSLFLPKVIFHYSSRSIDSDSIKELSEIFFIDFKELKIRGFKVPEDISVIGIDDFSSSEFTETSLTSIDTKPSDICTLAWDLLCKKLKNKYYRINQSIVVRPQLIIRESIANLKEEVV